MNKLIGQIMMRLMACLKDPNEEMTIKKWVLNLLCRATRRHPVKR